MQPVALNHLTSIEWNVDVLVRKLKGQTNFFVDSDDKEHFLYVTDVTISNCGHGWFHCYKHPGKKIESGQIKTEHGSDVFDGEEDEYRLLYKHISPGCYHHINDPTMSFIILRSHKKQFGVGVGQSHNLYQFKGGLYGPSSGWHNVDLNRQDFTKEVEFNLKLGCGPLTKDLYLIGSILYYNNCKIGIQDRGKITTPANYFWFIEQELQGICQINTL